MEELNSEIDDIVSYIKNSNEYKKWLELSQEEKLNAPMPNTYVLQIPEDLVMEFSKDNVPSILDEINNRKQSFSLESISASYSNESYNLNEDTKVEVKTTLSPGDCDEAHCFVDSSTAELKKATVREVGLNLINKETGKEETMMKVSIKYTQLPSEEDNTIIAVNNGSVLFEI